MKSEQTKSKAATYLDYVRKTLSVGCQVQTCALACQEKGLKNVRNPVTFCIYAADIVTFCGYLHDITTLFQLVALLALFVLVDLEVALIIVYQRNLLGFSFVLQA